MIKSKLLLPGVALSLAGLVLAACGGSTPAASPAPSVEPTTAVTEAPSMRTQPPAVEPTQAGPTPGGALPVIGGGSQPEAITADNLDRVNSLVSLPLASAVASISFSPDGKLLAAATSDGTVLFDIDSQKQLPIVMAGLSARLAVFSSDGHYLAIVPQDPAAPAVIWDVQANQESALLKDDLKDVAAVAFSPDGSKVATGTNAGVVTAYNLQADGTPVLYSMDLNEIDVVKNLNLGAPVPASTLTFSADSQLLAASADGMGVLAIWNAGDGSLKTAANAMGHVAGPVPSAMLSPADWTKVYWRDRGTIIAVDLATDQEVGRFSHEDFILGAAFSPDGKLLATSSSGTVNNQPVPLIKAWDVAAAAELRQMRGFSQIPSALAFSPAGSRLAVAVTGEGITLWGPVQNK